MKPPSTARTAGRSDWAERRFRRQPFILLSFSSSEKPQKRRKRSHTNVSSTLFTRSSTPPAQTAHVCFHGRKWVHTRLSEKNRTQGHTRRKRGRFGWGAIITLDTSCTFTNIPGPGIRTAYFAAFGSWPGVLPKNAESLRDSDAHDARRCSAGVAAPLGCVIFLQFGDVAVFFTLCAVLSECARWGWYHYPRCALRAAETLDGRLSKGLICRFLRLPSSTPCAVTFSANMQISLSAISVANTFALWYDKSQIRIFRR